MRIDEIRRKQNDPRNPWKPLSLTELKAVAANSRADMEAIRRSREQGLDRYDETQTGRTFDVIWVFESFIRTAGEDWTFLSVGGKHLLTDPRPTEEVYPEQYGERPLALGYGSFEAFRIFPMSPAESWQMLQQQGNELQNLTLDAVKQSVMPVAKVVRGKQVDLEALKKRGQGTAIMVNNADDVTWDRPPDIGAAVENLKKEIDIDFDDIAGQQNYGNVAQNNSLGKTLGGLKLAAGAANSVQEFDIRIWIETYVEKVLAQLVRLEQFYESDKIILGICGNKAKLLQKHGINEITDELLENEVTNVCNAGLGSGDPQQRLAKLSDAVGVITPILQASKDFQSGKRKINADAFIEEVFGAVGYKDGGARFFEDGEAQGPDRCFRWSRKSSSRKPNSTALAARASSSRASLPRPRSASARRNWKTGRSTINSTSISRTSIRSVARRTWATSMAAPSQAPRTPRKVLIRMDRQPSAPMASRVSAPRRFRTPRRAWSQPEQPTSAQAMPG
jgi:hypothetical protein